MERPNERHRVEADEWCRQALLKKQKKADELKKRVEDLKKSLKDLVVRNQAKQLKLRDSQLAEALVVRNQVVEQIQECHRRHLEELRDHLQQAHDTYRQTSEDCENGRDLRKSTYEARKCRAKKRHHQAEMEFQARHLEVEVAKEKAVGEVFDMFRRQ